MSQKHLVRLTRLLVATVLFVASRGAAAQSQRELTLPSERGTKLPSSNGEWTLYGESVENGTDRSLKLWIQEIHTASVRVVLPILRTMRVAWSGNGKAFYVVDESSSDVTRSYIYDAATLQRLDIAEEILRSDPDALPLSRAHSYFDVERWTENGSVDVRFHGHTDQAPVACFDLRYIVGRTGTVRRLSRQIWPATSTGCGA